MMCSVCRGRGERNLYEWVADVFSWKPVGVRVCGHCGGSGTAA